MTTANFNSATDHPLLLTIQAVRYSIQCYLDDYTAVRLMHVSKSIRKSGLLRGFTFHQHVFCVKSSLQLQRLMVLMDMHRMCITRMMLAHTFDETLINPYSGRSILPSTLVALVLGAVAWRRGSRSLFTDIATHM